MNCIALITARGGSKRLPGKNVMAFAGRPLIHWSCEAADAASTVRRMIVSTDSVEIAAAARAAGAEVPFRRPAELSGDISSHYDVIAHALDWIEADEGALPDYLCLLQPTSPLRTGADIDGTVALVADGGGDSAFSVSPVAIHPELMYRLGDDGSARHFLPPVEGYRRGQDMEPLFHVNGAVYVIRPHIFRQRRTVVSPDALGYVMPPQRSADIDDETDFVCAEALMLRFQSARIARSIADFGPAK
ncbi:acylneuraminate cytidylyltransferase family protein [Rhodopseudomonas palustris]|uniref:Acylneuraminate cytidylyltransferase family protein n=1 Tax=Rhodopseudomonas palustris TaxID=1076 RepID=A0AAX3E0M0_RHOPL|nr:acylneuraminate cytidylyltransferase family protein [Rhodopseudomonas palustris]UYO40503.1 acylneuraminate cytidylyltransferase family protein [Rhodopseudomonas palustris]